MSPDFWKSLIGTSEPGVVSRFSIIILSVLLLGTGLGQSFEDSFATFCGLVGCWGLTAYIALSLAGSAHRLETSTRQRESATGRIHRHLVRDCDWFLRKPALDEAG